MNHNMNNYEIDNIATNLLLWKKSDNMSKVIDEIKHRILEINFDCTLNWWILWANSSLKKENWYFIDERFKSHYYEKIKSLNIKNIYETLSKALTEIIWEKVNIEWFSVYWSYLYSPDKHPNDLDILVLVSWITWLTYDALKYPLDDEKLFIDDFMLNDKELWLTIISIDQLNEINKNYIVTDAALVDKWTSFTVWKWIDSHQIPDFVLNQNSQKLINWWIANLYGNVEALKKRVRESLYMREYIIRRWNLDFLRKININDLINNFDSKSKDELLNFSFQIVDILKEDEKHLRNKIVLDLK